MKMAIKGSKCNLGVAKACMRVSIGKIEITR